MRIKCGLRQAVASVMLLALTGALVFIPTESAQAACSPPPTDKGSVISSVQIPETGTYYIWSRNRTATTSLDSYYLKIDDKCALVVGDNGLAPNSWVWVNHRDGNTSSRIRADLTRGAHTLRLHGLDKSVQVDRLLITADPNCTPENFGDNCTGQSTPVTSNGTKNRSSDGSYIPITTIDSSTADDQKIVGIIQAGTEDPSTKTIIKVDGRIVASGYGVINYNTDRLTNGYHDITIETIHSNGQIESITKRIFVNNPLNEWELVYNWLMQTTSQNKQLTHGIIFLVSVTAFAGLAVLARSVWQRRLWETLPIIKNIHLPFLKQPHLYNRFFHAQAVSQNSSPSGTMVYGSLEQGVRLDSLPITIGGRDMTINVPAVVMVAIFSSIGALMVLLAVAQPNTRTVEPENGSRSGVAVLNDSSAAGGSYIQFGTGAAATCPAGQTGTPPNCKTPSKQFVSKCLARSGSVIRLTGLRKSQYKNQALQPNTIINAKGLTWDGRDSSNNPIPWVATFGGQGPACWFGGKYQGVWNDTDPNITWEDPYHHAGIATIRSPDFLMEGIRADNNGDGIRVENPGSNFHIRGVWVSNMHDDCFENDHMLGGIVEDSFFDGCYTGISLDHKSQSLDGSKNTMTFKDNLLWMKPMNTVFRGTAPGTAMLFKGWSPNRAVAPAMVITNNIFRIDQKTGFQKHQVPPLMNLKTCSNNTIVWTGAGVFPYSQYFPSCFKITKDMSVWTNAVKKWKDAHANIF